LYPHPLAWFHVFHHGVRPHASVGQLLRAPEATNRSGAAKGWRPSTPAMAAGVSEHMWTRQEVLRDRVPPWPQSSMVSELVRMLHDSTGLLRSRRQGGL